MNEIIKNVLLAEVNKFSDYIEAELDAHQTWLHIQDAEEFVDRLLIILEDGIDEREDV